MIVRIWQGWTLPHNADSYEALLRTTVFPGILAKNVPGFRRIELLRRPLEAETEFTTLMWFTDMDAVRAFAGERPEAAYVPQAARALLSRFDSTARHYTSRHAIET